MKHQYQETSQEFSDSPISRSLSPIGPVVHQSGGKKQIETSQCCEHLLSKLHLKSTTKHNPDTPL